MSLKKLCSYFVYVYYCTLGQHLLIYSLNTNDEQLQSENKYDKHNKYYIIHFERYIFFIYLWSPMASISLGTENETIDET